MAPRTWCSSTPPRARSLHGFSMFRTSNSRNFCIRQAPAISIGKLWLRDDLRLPGSPHALMPRLWLPIGLIAALWVTSAVMVRAQHDHPPPALPDNFKEPMRLYSAPNVL